MDPLLGIIFKIKQLPTLYIGKRSLTSLLDFLDGYICCLIDHVGEENRTFNLPEFLRYAQSVYAICDLPIKQMFLEQNDNDEGKAFDKFYELLDSYLNPDPEEMSKYWHDRRFIPPLPRDHKLSRPWRESLGKPETVEISYVVKDKIKEPFDGDCIQNEKDAAEIAKTIFKSAFGNKYNHELPPIVRFDAKNEAWLIFSHVPDDIQKDYYTIIMRKRNAEVVAIWETKE